MSQLVGIIFYLILLFILAIGFAFFNLDPGEIAEGMQKVGIILKEFVQERLLRNTSDRICGNWQL